MTSRCPLCGSDEGTLFERYGMIGSADYECRVFRCTNCQHYFTVIGKEANIELLYGEGQYEILDTRGSLFDKIVAFDDRVILQQMRKLTLSGKRLLDFGCGKGQFLHRALDYGWQGQGIETGKKRAEFGQNVYGLKINTLEYHGGLVDGGLFDAITLFHVLEHLRNPKAVMEELVKSNLKDGGLLVIEVPNFGSLQSKIAGKYWLHLDPPLHVSHFSKSSLVKLLDELSLVPVRFEGLSLHLGVLGMVQAIMSIFGYRKMIIYELKFRRTKRLTLSVLAVLLPAMLLEFVASFIGKGGVCRIYSKKRASIEEAEKHEPRERRSVVS